MLLKVSLPPSMDLDALSRQLYEFENLYFFRTNTARTNLSKDRGEVGESRMTG